MVSTRWSEPQDDPAVEQAEAHRRAVGEGDLVGRRPEVVGGGVGNRGVELALVLDHVAVGVGVETAPVAIDRIGHGPRMGGEREGGEVRDVGRQRELRPHRVPVARIELSSSNGRRRWPGRIPLAVVTTAGHATTAMPRPRNPSR